MATGNLNLNKDDLQNKYVSFSSKDSLEPISYDEIEKLESKENLSDVFLKMSLLLKNSRYIKNVIGDKNEFSVYSSNLSSGIKTLYNIAEQMSDDISKMINWNLLEGTRLFSGSSWVFPNLTSEYYEGFRINSFTGAWNGVGQKPDFFKVGEVYTFSAYVNFTTDLCTFVTCNDTGGGNASFESRSLPTETGTWARASFTFKVTKDGILNPRFESTKGTLKVCGLKLERGYNDTGWAPNPNDDSLFLSLSGGTMNKDSGIIIPSNEDDRYTRYGAGESKYVYPTKSSFAAGYGYYDQSNNLLGGIGLYGVKGVPSYYYIGNYSDPFVKVDMDGISTFAKDAVFNGDIKPYYTKGIYWRESTYGDQFKIVPTFGGFDDSNMLLIQSAVGEKDTLPDLTTKISIAAKTGNTTFEGSITSKGNLSISGTINKITTKYVFKTENGGRPTYLLAFDITDWYLNGSTSKWGFNGFIYSSRSSGYNNQEEVATVIMDCAYSKATTIGSTLRLATNNGNYRPCIIHDTTNDKYYLSLKLSGQGRDLILQGYAKKTMNTTQINSIDSSGSLPDGYEFTFDPSNCTTGMNISSSCSGNSKSASLLKNSYSNGTGNRPVSADVNMYSDLGTVSYMVASSDMTTGKPGHDGHILTFKWDNSTGNGAQLFIPNNKKIYAQYRACDSSGWEGWRTFLDSYNYSKYAIPLAGTSALAGNIIPKSTSYQLGSDTYPFSQGYFTTAYVKSGLYSLYHYIRDSAGKVQGRLEGNSTTAIMYQSVDNSTSDTIGADLFGTTNLRLRAGSRVYLSANTSISASRGISVASDAKIKEFTDDIEQDKKALIKLFDIIQIKTYRYRYSDKNKLTLGFSAQDVEKACNEMGIDPEKYGILNIMYNHYMYRGDDDEDIKYYTKFYEISYNDLYNLALLKIQSMEKEHNARLESIEERLAAIENK